MTNEIFINNIVLWGGLLITNNFNLWKSDSKVNYKIAQKPHISWCVILSSTTKVQVMVNSNPIKFSDWLLQVRFAYLFSCIEQFSFFIKGKPLSKPATRLEKELNYLQPDHPTSYMQVSFFISISTKVYLSYIKNHRPKT